MENYDYWIHAYAVIFSLLIASLSFNSLFFIKNKINKILCFFIFLKLYALILSYFFERASVGYTQQEFLPKFIYEGYRMHIFQGNISLLITFVAIILLICKIFIENKKDS